MHKLHCFQTFSTRSYAISVEKTDFRQPLCIWLTLSKKLIYYSLHQVSPIIPAANGENVTQAAAIWFFLFPHLHLWLKRVTNPWHNYTERTKQPEKCKNDLFLKGSAAPRLRNLKKEKIIFCLSYDCRDSDEWRARGGSAGGGQHPSLNVVCNSKCWSLIKAQSIWSG